MTTEEKIKITAFAMALAGCSGGVDLLVPANTGDDGGFVRTQEGELCGPAPQYAPCVEGTVCVNLYCTADADAGAK